jgi:hypothetical protein
MGLQGAYQTPVLSYHPIGNEALLARVAFHGHSSQECKATAIADLMLDGLKSGTESWQRKGLLPDILHCGSMVHECDMQRPPASFEALC